LGGRPAPCPVGWGEAAGRPSRACRARRVRAIAGSPDRVHERLLRHPPSRPHQLSQPGEGPWRRPDRRHQRRCERAPAQGSRAAAGPTGLPSRPPSVEPWVVLDRVLAVRLDAAGDVVMTTPALRALKRGGVRHLALLTSASGAAAAQLLPEVDEIIVHEAAWM